MTATGFALRLFRPTRPAASRRHRWSRDRLIGGTVIALIVLAMLVLFADAASVTLARGMSKPVIATFRFITDFGKAAFVLWPAGIVLLILIVMAAVLPRPLARKAASIATRALFFFVAVALPVWFTDIVKGVVGRARPFVGGAADPLLLRPLDWTPAYASFPSGHATTALAVAVAVGALWPRLRTAAWIYAALILVSRVILIAHHPSDVIAGAAVGGFGALLVRDYFAKRSLGFAIGKDGRVHVLPWPRLRSRLRRRP